MAKRGDIVVLQDGEVAIPESPYVAEIEYRVVEVYAEDEGHTAMTIAPVTGAQPWAEVRIPSLIHDWVQGDPRRGDRFRLVVPKDKAVKPRGRVRILIEEIDG